MTGRIRGMTARLGIPPDLSLTISRLDLLTLLIWTYNALCVDVTV